MFKRQTVQMLRAKHVWKQTVQMLWDMFKRQTVQML